MTDFICFIVGELTTLVKVGLDGLVGTIARSSFDEEGILNEMEMLKKYPVKK